MGTGGTREVHLTLTELGLSRCYIWWFYWSRGIRLSPHDDNFDRVTGYLNRARRVHLRWLRENRRMQKKDMYFEEWCRCVQMSESGGDDDYYPGYYMDCAELCEINWGNV